MRRYTDAILTITAENAHFTTAQEIHVTFAQAFRSVDITGDAISIVGDEELTVTLTQSQTATLNSEPAKLEVNYIDSEGKRKASEVVTIDVLENLLERVLDDQD